MNIGIESTSPLNSNAINMNFNYEVIISKTNDFRPFPSRMNFESFGILEQVLLRKLQTHDPVLRCFLSP